MTTGVTDKQVQDFQCYDTCVDVVWHHHHQAQQDPHAEPSPPPKEEEDPFHRSVHGCDCWNDVALQPCVSSVNRGRGKERPSPEQLFTRDALLKSWCAGHYADWEAACGDWEVQAVGLDAGGPPAACQQLLATAPGDYAGAAAAATPPARTPPGVFSASPRP